MSYCYARFWGGGRQNPSSYSGDFEFYGEAQDIYNYLSGLSASNISCKFNNGSPNQTKWDSFLDILENNLNTLCGGGIPVTPFVCFSFGDLNEYRSYFLGKRFTFDLHLYVYSDLAIRFDFAFSDNNPQNSTVIPDCNISYLYNNVCSRVDNQTLSEQIQELKDVFPSNPYNLIFTLVSGFTSSVWNGVDCDPHDYNPPVQCDDTRTSVPPHTLRFTITNGVLSVTKDLDCYCTAMDNVFPFDSTVFTAQEIRDIFTMFMSYMANPIRCACRFISGVVRSNCSVKLNVNVTGYRCYIGEVGGIFGIGYEDLTPTQKQLFDATFIECLDKPVSYTENLSSYCQGLVNSGDGWLMFFDPLNITVSNLECESDVCCDDVSDDEIDEIEAPQIDTIGGFSSGGGSDVDLTCICEGLTSLNQMLATKLDNLVDGQAVIADAISDIQVDVSSDDLVEAVEGVSAAIGNIDNSCICDGLEDIDTTLKGLDLSVTNTVTPCQPIVTNPVNNITVTPSTAQVTVEPCSPTITVEPSSVTVDLTGIEASLDTLNDSMSELSSNLSGVGDGFSCNDKGLACILEDALNLSKVEDGQTVKKSITEVIDSKTQDVNVETIVEPCDYTFTRRASLDDLG